MYWISRILAVSLGIATLFGTSIKLSHAEEQNLSPSVIKSGATEPPDPACPIKGNISHNTGRKLYHLPGMEDYDNTVIDLERGERWFCSESEAINAGWTKAPA